MEESAGQDLVGNTQQTLENWGGGGWEAVTKCLGRGKVWEYMCTSANHAFYLIIIGNSELLFLIKA